MFLFDAMFVSQTSQNGILLFSSRSTERYDEQQATKHKPFPGPNTNTSTAKH